ncbi:MAG TPA: 4-alpha-glucanotransferase [Thermomicrobiales bacterium]|nr:4-alpha-glucanotransferase [Thermomicrobiales bacterium]
MASGADQPTMPESAHPQSAICNPQSERASGVLLHPTSLPGPYGVGELGPAAVAFLDFLAAAGQRLWQVLPLGPTAEGDSPYTSPSAFAGNPLLVSVARLRDDGLLDRADLADAPAFPTKVVAYEAVRPYKEGLLRRAHARFRPDAAFRAFAAREGAWLDDYALFAALRARHGGAHWWDWEPPLARRKPAALARARRALADELGFQRFVQYRFCADYAALRRAARARGIRLIGDLPIFVARDSADVWAHPDLFLLDADGAPTAVAGVPPDYYSATGQLWGNPLYRWDAMARDGYAWWTARLRAALALYDLVRLDHFRGFEAYWAVPAGAETAANGRWVAGPRDDFFDAARAALGGLPFIAEDLGLITPEVHALRERVGLPGMKVLQFAFSDPDSPYLPHTFTPDCVVYTGTHDNDTTRGWWAAADDAERAFARRYLGRDGADIAWDLIRLAFGSVAALAVVPLQDVLDLGSAARMNTPGVPTGNWAWRCPPGALTPALAARLRDLATVYGRAPDVP